MFRTWPIVLLRIGLDSAAGTSFTRLPSVGTPCSSREGVSTRPQDSLSSALMQVDIGLCCQGKGTGSEADAESCPLGAGLRFGRIRGQVETGTAQDQSVSGRSDAHQD
ncbi:hypothetical protein BC827DRAFT_690529 [Russula dissimulans]|nr:hypothetical protein BC827DRAFT_690529 [Russula dissimulans]